MPITLPFSPTNPLHKYESLPVPQPKSTIFMPSMHSGIGLPHP